MRCTRNVRLFLWIAVLFVSLSTPTHCLTAQVVEVTPPTAELLKRLAEAVDGYRSGGEVYVVATSRPPYTVVGVYETRASADAALTSAGVINRAPRVFGPYMSASDGTPHVRAFVSDTCEHLAFSRIDCPSISANDGAAEFMRAVDVDSVIVSIRTRNGRTRRIAYGPDVDALFFTPAAIDKFVIPYYVRIIGVDSAAAYRKRLLARLP